MAEVSELEQYRHHVQDRLQALAPVFAKAAIGDFTGQVPPLEEDDELTEFFVGVQIILDTIREKVTELETSLGQLQAANDVIASEKSRIEAILDGMGEGLVTVDDSWHTTYINEPAVALLGEPARIVGQDATAVLRLENANGDPVPEARHPIIKAVGSRKRISLDVTKGTPYYVRSGTERRRIGFTITPILRGGQVAGAAIVLRDITDEANMDRAKSEIISIASHQLRTPLTAIRWYVAALLKDEDTTPKQHDDYLQRIHDANQHMIQLVDDLLNVSRIDLGTLTLQPRPIELAPTLRSVLKELAVEIANKKLTVRQANADNLLPVLIDPNSLHMILQNLVSNAVKYSHDGMGIDVGVEQRGGMARVTVADQGVGIPADQQSKIFSKLFRASNAQSIATDGTGLGLYVAKALAERAGGSIWFESTQGKGSTFCVSLPSYIANKKEE